MRFKQFLKVITTILTSCIPFINKAQQQKQPNIILIYTDDQGYGDLGCFGASGYKTPNIDKLAENGIRFTDFYAPQAVSSASRAGLLSGCYPNRIGISGALMPNANKGINEEEILIPELLKQKGYNTAIFGKWHLGDHRKFNPINHGFDLFYGIPYSIDMLPMSYDGIPGGSKTKYPLLPVYWNDSIISHLNSLPGIDTLTRFLTEKSVEFISNNKNKPFFIYFPHPMPHTPLGVSEKFRNSTKQGKYGDVISEIDWSVGQIVAELKKHKLLENTLIIFTSDNGPWLNFGLHAGSTAGLREGKGTSWEGGQRVPCIMYWKDQIPKGIVSNKICSAIDILPTLAEITGTKLPNRKIDGISILSLMKNKKNADPRNVFLYYYENNQLQAIRYGDWKLVYPHTYRSYLGVEPGKNGMPGAYNTAKCQKELYNLISDRNESNNVIDNYPEIVAIIDSIANEAREDLGDFLTNSKGKNNREPGYSQIYFNEINHLAKGSKVVYETDYSNKYSGNGNSTLTDGITGFSDFSHKAWQGFEGNDFIGTLELSDSLIIKNITVGFFSDENSWIFLPEEVRIEFSVDGKIFTLLNISKTEDIKQTKIMNRMELCIQKNIKAKYLKFSIKNIKVCPDYHTGKGLPAWLFMDEIVVN